MSHCLIYSQSHGSLKSHVISLKDKFLMLRRLDEDQIKTLRHRRDVNSLQVVKCGFDAHCMLIIGQKSCYQLKLHFESDERADLWYDLVIREQGFPR